MWLPRSLDGPKTPSPPARRWADAEVLELGCGRGLPGWLALELGAKSVCHTDCDDRALEGIEGAMQSSGSTYSPTQHQLRHLLWEQDLEDEAHALASDPARKLESKRHWSDASRLEKYPKLGTRLKHVTLDAMLP